jgi:small GTP-binding protein
MSSPPKQRNIVVFGEPGVGKTCFTDQFLHDSSFVSYNPVDPGLTSRQLTVDGESSNLSLMDLSTAFLKPENEAQSQEWAKKILEGADGIVLLYDVASMESFDYVTDQAYKFLWGCRKLADEDDETRQGFGSVLVGNKLDLVSSGQNSREVNQNLAEEWAQSQGMRCIEVDCLNREGPEESLKLVVKNIKKVERIERLESKVEKKQPVKELRADEKKSGTVGNTIKKVFRSFGA